MTTGVIEGERLGERLDDTVKLEDTLAETEGLKKMGEAD